MSALAIDRRCASCDRPHNFHKVRHIFKEPNTIAARRVALEREIDRLRDALGVLQVECEHTFAVKTERSDRRDTYWYDCRCTDCGWGWIEAR